MKSKSTQVTSKNIKKGVTAIVIGILVVAGGVSMGVSSQTATMTIMGLILDIFGVLLALSGMGYLVGVLGRKS